jgi:hypothetical protein
VRRRSTSNIEEITNDFHKARNYYARIKVLTEKGKELATVRFLYLDNGYYPRSPTFKPAPFTPTEQSFRLLASLPIY